MTDAVLVNEIEAAIGYSFRDKRYLIAALTHSSYANEHGGEHNERLEFLGDGLLGFIAAYKLYRGTLEREGKMTVGRQRMVSRGPLARAVDKMGLVRHLRRGKNVAVSEKMKADLFEAILAAIYLDSGENLAAATAFTERYIEAAEEIDFKSGLQEYAQGKGIALPAYVTEAAEAGFTCRVTVDGREFCGEGSSKKRAEQAAAKEALSSL